MALTKLIVNCETGEQEIVELTPAEVAEVEAAQAQAELDREARDAEARRIEALKTSAKAKLVAGEKLSADEAALLIG
jgi:hypothetical protein